MGDVTETELNVPTSVVVGGPVTEVAMIVAWATVIVELCEVTAVLLLVEIVV